MNLVRFYEWIVQSLVTEEKEVNVVFPVSRYYFMGQSFICRLKIAGDQQLDIYGKSRKGLLSVVYKGSTESDAVAKIRKTVNEELEKRNRILSKCDLSDRPTVNT